MVITVFGATGRTGGRIVSQLLDAGHQVRAVVRGPDRITAVERSGAQGVLGDLTGDPEQLALAVSGSDVVINAAGVSKPTSSDLLRVDRDGAIAAARAARAQGVPRFIQVSAMPANRPQEAPTGFRAYLRAKNDSDTALAESGLLWTVIRPGGLTNGKGTGRVRVGAALDDGSISRDDLAAVVVACLDQPLTGNRAFDVVSGARPITEALAAPEG